MCFSISADVCWHSSDVHWEKFSSLLPGGAQRKRVQPAQAVHPQVLQLDQSRHALPERSQIRSCTQFSNILTQSFFTFYIVRNFLFMFFVVRMLFSSCITFIVQGFLSCQFISLPNKGHLRPSDHLFSLTFMFGLLESNGIRLSRIQNY